MTHLEQVWRAWRALSRADRARFLIMFREQYSRERAAVVRKNGHAAHGPRAASLSDLSLTVSDVRAAAME